MQTKHDTYINLFAQIPFRQLQKSDSLSGLKSIYALNVIATIRATEMIFNLSNIVRV